jgi:hypothetical protein
VTYSDQQLRIRLWRQALSGRWDAAPCDGCGRRIPSAYFVTLETPARAIVDFKVCLTCAPPDRCMVAARTWADVVATRVPPPQPDPDLGDLVG